MKKKLVVNGINYEIEYIHKNLGMFHMLRVNGDGLFFGEDLCTDADLVASIHEMERKIKVFESKTKIIDGVRVFEETVDVKRNRWDILSENGFENFIEHDIVSYFVADILSQSGFDEVCNFTYGNKTQEVYESPGAINSNLDRFSEHGTITAPSVSQARKWLNERMECHKNLLNEMLK